jgi:hypothetical protein
VNLRLFAGVVAVAAAAILVDAAWDNRGVSVATIVIGLVLVVGPHVYLANRGPQ